MVTTLAGIDRGERRDFVASWGSLWGNYRRMTTFLFTLALDYLSSRVC
jgi:hypothetical protein